MTPEMRGGYGRPGSESPERAHAGRVALALFCACLVAYGYFIYRGPHHNPDSRLALTYAIVERGVLDIDKDAAGTLDRASVGGHSYTDKAPGLSVLLVPAYVGLRRLLPAVVLDPSPPGWRTEPDPPAGTPAQGPAPDRFVVRYLLTWLGIGVPAALFAAFLFHWLARLEPRVGPRLVVAGGYALGSPVYAYTASAFGHVPAGMCLFGAFALLDGWNGARRREVGGAGLLLGLAVAIEYPVAVALPAIVAYGFHRAGTSAGSQTVVRRRWRLAVWLLAGAAPPLVLLAGYHWAVFGLPWGVGYARLDAASAYASGQAEGLLGVRWPSAPTAMALLTGQRRGLLVHAPWLVLALPGAALLWRRRPAIVVVAAGVTGALLAVNSGYVYWDGGAAWGPRHLVPALPFLAVLALPGAVRWPGLAVLLTGASALLTLAAVATRTLPDPDVAFPLRDVLLPRILSGAVTNQWGQLLGLTAARGLVPLAALVLLLCAWVTGWRRAAGWLVAGLWALHAAATLHRAYLEYSEGYYLYLGARLAAGARLYADSASTQPPLLPLLVSLLWRVTPDVYLPRLLAIALYLLTALLAGRLGARLAGDPRIGVAATLLTALLPLGAGTVQVLDANTVLAPLGPAVALLWLRGERTQRRGLDQHGEATGTSGLRLAPYLMAGAVAAAGLSTKLTFLAFALAPVAASLVGSGLSRRAWSRRGAALGLYGAGLLVVAGGHLGIWLGVAGPVALDGVFGELESPIVPLGAVLAALQLLQLEGLALVLAALGWWRARPWARPWSRRLGRIGVPATPGVPGADVAWWCGLAAATMPLLALHQGTFVGVARPAEPFIAVYASLAAGALWPRLGRMTVPVAVGAAAAIAVWHDARSLADRSVVPPEVVVARLAGADPSGDVLAPPYYAALAGRRMLFDYADWTVLGMRAAAGVPREQVLTRRLVGALDAGDVPLVAADFRLTYIPGVAEALAGSYVEAGDDGDQLARRIVFYAPAA